MSTAATGPVVRRWRIVGSDIWDRDYLDVMSPASITIGRRGHGELEPVS